MMAILRSILILGISLCAVTPSTIYAGNNAGYVYRDFDTPIEPFERPDVRRAVENYCRLLGLDPYGKTVEQNLAAIKAYPLTAGQRSDVYLLEDLVYYNQNLKERIDYLMAQRDTLIERLAEQGFDRLSLINDLQAIRDDVSRSGGILTKPTVSADRYDPVDIVNNLLREERAALALQVRSLEEQFAWLRTVSRDERHVRPPYIPRTTAYADVPTDEYRESVPLEEIVIPLREKKEVEPIDPGIDAMKGELGSLNRQLEDLQERLGKEDGRIKDLTDQIIELSLRLSETEMLINEKAETIASLRSDLTDMEQRLMLGQRIIREKDEEIRALRDDLQMAKLEKGTSRDKLMDSLDSKDRTIAQLEAFLEIYRDGLVRARREIEEKAAHLRQAGEQLAQLRAQMQAGRSMAAAEGPQGPARRIVESKDEKLIELSGMLQIYREKLGEGTKTIKKNLADITALKEQLLFVQEELQQKNAQLDVTQQNLDELEDQLTALKQELLRFRERPGRSEFDGGSEDPRPDELSS